MCHAPQEGAATLGFLSEDALRAAAPQLAPVVAALLNGCSTVGSLPAACALSLLTPGLKPLTRALQGHFCGLGISRVYASMIKHRLSAWAEDMGLRSRGQAGFRKDHHRCSDHLLTLRILKQQRAKREGNCMRALLISPQHTV